MRKLLFLIAVLIVQSSNAFCQNENGNFILGLNRQHYNTLELGFALFDGDRIDSSYGGGHICGEYLFRYSEPGLAGLKVGFDVCRLVFIFSGQAAYYFNKYEKNFLVRPEIGWTALGFGDLTYGYNIFITKGENSSLGNHVLSFRLRIPIGF